MFGSSSFTMVFVVSTLLWIWQGPPCRSALRKLAEKFLKRQIQKGTHDSVDDARAAMDLVLLKIRCAFS